ncbi:LptF/LptG family permease [bacterium]|nr:LptF/LptG family permease [bacterium]
MKILTRYVLKEFIAPFFLSLFCFTFILLLNDIFKWTKTFVQKGVNVWYLVELLIYALPSTLVVTIPMATLVGLLLLFGRLSAENEITAMKASGVGIHQLLPSILLVSMGLSIFNFLFMDYALPRGNVAYWRLITDIRVRHPALILTPGIADDLDQDGRKWMFESKDEKTGRLQNVKIWDEYRDGKPRLIEAKEGELEFSDSFSKLKLYNGFTYEEATKENPQRYQVINFKEMQVNLDLSEQLQRGEYNSQNPLNMSLAELSKYMKETRKQYSEEKEYLKYRLLRAEVEYQKKFAIPFACFAFSLIGVPLGIVVRRSGKMVGAGIGLGVIIVYYVLLQIGQTTGFRGVLPAPLAIWMPNVLIGIAGVILIIRTVREMPVHRHPWLMKLFPTTGGETDSESHLENP